MKTVFNQRRADTLINKWVREARCPLCLGVDSTLYHHPSLGNFKGEMNLTEALSCESGHLISVIGFNSPELFMLSVMDEHKRPTKKVAA